MHIHSSMHLHLLLYQSFTFKSQLVEKKASVHLENTYCLKPFDEYWSCAVVLDTPWADLNGARKNLTFLLCMAVSAAASMGSKANRDAGTGGQCCPAHVAYNGTWTATVQQKFHGLD